MTLRKDTTATMENRTEMNRKISRAETEMGMSNYIVPLLGNFLVASLTFYLGANGYSYIMWIGVIMLLNVAKTYLWQKRERKLMALRATATREREVIMAALQELPAWVQFPDTERVEWINKVILQLWPYIGEYAKVFMTDFIIPQVKAQMPGIFKNFKFTKMDMGDIPCRVGGIKVYTTNVGRDKIIVDMDIAYAGDADFSISCCGFSGGMNCLVFSGKLRCILKPLLPFPPMVGGVSGSFLEMPKFDFNLTGMGEFVELPGLMNAIKSVIDSQVAAICVLPNEIVVPLAPNVDVTQLFFPEPDGVVRLKVIEAKNLENKDISFIKKGKSDPYAEIQVGSQFMKTRTIDNDLNPVWNEYFEAVVDQADGQWVRIEVFDEDQGKDEELGRLSVDLKDIQQSGVVDQWYPLEGCKHGDLHIKSTWMDLSSDPVALELEEKDAEWAQTNTPMHPALLMVYVDAVSDLPYPKSRLEPSPFIEVKLGKEVQRTPVKKIILKFSAFDDGTRRPLGALSIPLKSLIREPNMEYYQQTFFLQHGVHQSPIVLTVRLRALIRRQFSMDRLNSIDDTTLAAYANAQYIERGRQNGISFGNGNGSIAADTQAVEPAKAVNQNGGFLDPENRLNVENINMLRSESNQSLGLKSNSSRLGKLFGGLRRRDNKVEQHNGSLEISIRQTGSTNKLVVLILRARDLPDRGSPVYVAVKLFSTESGKVVAKRKTSCIKSTEPIFDNHFEFDMHPSDVHNHKLSIAIKEEYSNGIFSNKPTIGQIEFSLNSLTNNELKQQWVPLSQ